MNKKSITNIASLGNKLKTLRKRNGLSINDVCELLNNSNMPICIQTIYKWEKDESSPDLKYLNALCNIYNVRIGSLFESGLSCQALDDNEEKFILSLRNNEIYKRIIYLITKNDKEDLKNGDSIIV